MHKGSETDDQTNRKTIETVTVAQKNDGIQPSWTLSYLERIIAKGPIPNSQTNPVACVLNLAFYSCILPAFGYAYVSLSGLKILTFPLGMGGLSIEFLVLWIASFLFVYSCLVYHTSHRFRKFLAVIEPCLEYDRDQFGAFEQKTIMRVFKPPVILLALLLITVPFGVYAVVSNPIYSGNIVITVLLGLMLAYTSILHWMAAWLLYTFLDTSKRFGRDVPLHVNPFAPDKVGGLAPLSDLSTLAVFCVGLLSVLVIPIWQIFFPPASYLMISITSILIPAYFLFAMRGIYNRLREERESALAELNDEIQQVSKRIRSFMKIDHKKERFDEKETVLLGQTLNSIDIIYGHVRSMHTFPINAEIMAKVFISAILPILAVILNFTLTHLVS